MVNSVNAYGSPFQNMGGQQIPYYPAQAQNNWANWQQVSNMQNPNNAYLENAQRNMQQQNQQRPVLSGRFVTNENEIAPGEASMSGEPSFFPLKNPSGMARPDGIVVKVWESDGLLHPYYYTLYRPETQVTQGNTENQASGDFQKILDQMDQFKAEVREKFEQLMSFQKGGPKKQGKGLGIEIKEDVVNE